ncbi:universal stress protein [Actinomycetospora sp. TBRC 11914]|uniref:universal stress protein n=1 Tax=Actinomycetospora sp. TBRC 11914 TaxID=2729387 RepID=UPI00145DF55C|nr:universal stress protein [Actinomycetospora sp. TBRC 11914]NMO89516.1 universal stress protein [Actinomycetospora sp. TBRC 11914]
MTQHDAQTAAEVLGTATETATETATATGVVVGVDDSASARAAVAWAAAAAVRRDVALHLVEVLPGPADPADAVGGAGPAAPRGRARALLSRARDIALATSPGLTVTMHTRSGRVGTALVEHAADAALLVLGSNGPGGPIPLSLGSVLAETTRHCSCPVVLVPPATRRRAPSGEEPVLVALEDSPDGEKALAFAADVAARRGAALTVLGGPAEAGTAGEPAALGRLRERRPDLTIRYRTISAPLADALLAADTDAGLLVTPPLRRRASREHPVAGWTAHFLPVLSTCPVAVVSAHSRWSTAL